MQTVFDTGLALGCLPDTYLGLSVCIGKPHITLYAIIERFEKLSAWKCIYLFGRGLC